MADGLPAFELPPGTVPIVRNASASSTTGTNQVISLGYTVPAGKRCVVLTAYLSVVMPAAAPVAGNAGIRINVPEFSAVAQICLGIAMPATINLTLANSVECVIPTTATSTVDVLVNNMDGATITAGFSGYEEALEH